MGVDPLHIVPGFASVDWDARGPFTGLIEVNHPFEIRIGLSALIA